MQMMSSTVVPEAPQPVSDRGVKLSDGAVANDDVHAGDHDADVVSVYVGFARNRESIEIKHDIARKDRNRWIRAGVRQPLRQPVRPRLRNDERHGEDWLPDCGIGLGEGCRC
jgi:hypothetical protein